MSEGFTIKCNKCGVEIQIKSKKDLYKAFNANPKELPIRFYLNEEYDYGWIDCECGQNYDIYED